MACIIPGYFGFGPLGETREEREGLDIRVCVLVVVFFVGGGQ